MVKLSGLLVVGIWSLSALTLGYPLFCLLRTLGKRGLQLDWAELAFTSALLGTLFIGWLGLLLVEIGRFSLTTLAMGTFLALVGAGVGIWVRGGSLRPQSDAPSRATWLLLLLLVLALVAFSHPAEFILGGGDAGVYVNLGANIARTGSLLIHEDGLTALPPSLWPGLFRQMSPSAAVRYVRFPGFYLSDDASGLVVPQFFPLHPVWLGICNGLLGLRASLYITPLWAALGVVAVALSLKRAFDTRVGLLSGALLLIVPTQVYFARYPTTEPLTQFLIWGGLYGFVAFTTDGHPLWGLLGGWALGEVFLTRIDAVPLLILPLVWLIYTLRRRSWREQLWFLAPFGILLLQAAFHTVLFSWPYAWEVYGGVYRLGVHILQRVWWLLAILLLSALALFWATRRSPALPGRGYPVARRAGAAVLVALGVFAYFVWPRIGHTVMASYWYGGNTIPIQNHLNLLRLGWYLSPLGVWLGIVGMALMLLRGNASKMWPVVITGLIFSMVYLYNILNNPFYVYAMRRYVPVVFPFFAAGMAYALTWLWEQRRRWRPAAGAAWGLGLVLVGWLVYNNREVWNLVEYRGLVSQVETLAGELEPGAVLLFEDDAPVGAGGTIGTPLQYLHGFTAFDLQEEHIVPAALAEAVADWQAAGRAVYWVKGPRASDLHLPFRLEPAVGFWIHVPLLEQSYDHFPLLREEYQVPLEFYRLNPEEAGCDFPVEIDVGTLDTLYLRAGFYSKERWGGRTVRWTTDEAILDLPCLPNTLPGVVSLAVQVASGRPDGFLSSRITMELDGEPLGEWELGRDFQVVEVQISGTMLEGVGHSLTLHSDTWVPRQHGVGMDSRVLGAVVDWVTVSAGGSRE